MVRIFEGFGFRAAGQKGSHLKLKRLGPDGGGQTLIVAMHPEMDKGTPRGIFVQACRFVSEAELRGWFHTE